MIILKENEWAEQMIRRCDLGKKPSETLRRVARYYLDQKYSPKQTRSKLEEFLLRCDPSVSIILWSDVIDFSIRYAQKNPAADIDSIVVTDKEMEKIDSLESRPARRLAFTLLCLSKYWMIVRPQCRHWVINPDNEIMKLANIGTSIRRQSQLYNMLRGAGMIRFSKKVDNTNVCVLFETDGKPVLHVSDFRNLGYQYLMYHGEPYFKCVNCGIVTKIEHPENSRGQKYCKSCAVEVATRQKVNYAMRRSGRIQNCENLECSQIA